MADPCGQQRPRARSSRGTPIEGAGQVEQVLRLGVVHGKGPREGMQHAARDPAKVPAFHPGVVGGADPSKLGDLLAAQARDATLAAEHRHARLLRREARAQAREVLLDVLVEIHVVDARACAAVEGGPGIHPLGG